MRKIFHYLLPKKSLSIISVFTIIILCGTILLYINCSSGNQVLATFDGEKIIRREMRKIIFLYNYDNDKFFIFCYNNYMNRLKSQKGFIKEVLAVFIAILTLAYFNVDMQTAAEYIKTFFG